MKIDKSIYDRVVVHGFFGMWIYVCISRKERREGLLLIVYVCTRTHHSSRPSPSTSHHGSLAELEIDPNEPRYCICNQVSFGDMVGCDGENVSSLLFFYLYISIYKILYI